MRGKYGFDAQYVGPAMVLTRDALHRDDYPLWWPFQCLQRVDVVAHASLDCAARGRVEWKG